MPITRYVDLDGTLAYYDRWEGATNIGPPIFRMVSTVKKWIANGDKVVIFTTRINPNSTFTLPQECAAAKEAVEAWCQKHIGAILEVTSEKGFFDKGYDDKQEHIVPNLGMTREEEFLAIICYLRNYVKKDDTYILNVVVSHLSGTISEQNG
jgi:hypothetical protein